MIKGSVITKDGLSTPTVGDSILCYANGKVEYKKIEWVKFKSMLVNVYLLEGLILEASNDHQVMTAAGFMSIDNAYRNNIDKIISKHPIANHHPQMSEEYYSFNTAIPRADEAKIKLSGMKRVGDFYRQQCFSYGELFESIMYFTEHGYSTQIEKLEDRAYVNIKRTGVVKIRMRSCKVRNECFATNIQSPVIFNQGGVYIA